MWNWDANASSAFSMIVKTYCETDGSFAALVSAGDRDVVAGAARRVHSQDQ